MKALIEKTYGTTIIKILCVAFRTNVFYYTTIRFLRDFLYLSIRVNWIQTTDVILMFADICIEQMDYIHDLAEKRLQLVLNGERSGISKAVGWRGGGSFVYLELKKYNQVFIDEIESATKTDELLAIWEKMKQKAFFRFNVDMQKFDEGIEEFKAQTLEQQKECLCKMLDLNQLYVNRSDMEDETAKVTEEEKRITKNFYQEA